jgi:hypothetical protein
MSSQRSDIEAVDLAKVATKALQDLREGQQAVRAVRRHAVLSVLLSASLQVRDLCRFWHVWRGARGISWPRLLPSSSCHMPEILHFHRLRGCGLVGLPTDARETMAPTHQLLHPACQCDTMSKKPLLTLSGRAAPRHHSRQRVVNISERGRPVAMPEWSAAVVWTKDKLKLFQRLLQAE